MLVRGNLKERQKEERFELVKEREAQLRTIVMFDLARNSLIAERQAASLLQEQQRQPEPQHTGPAVAQDFNTSMNTRASAQMAQVDKIKRQMEEWRKRNAGRDYGREM